MELKFTNGMIETQMNFDGVEVKIEKIEEDQYKIYINDPKNRFIQENLVGLGYKYLDGNNITFHRMVNSWWSNGVYEIQDTGYFKNGDKFTKSQIEIILDAIVNGLEELKRIKKPEIIKVYGVTITKEYYDSEHVILSVEGLRDISDYPNAIYYDKKITAYSMHDRYSLYNDDGKLVYINGIFNLPLNKFNVKNADADLIIDTIKKSEMRIEKYENSLKRVAKGFDYPEYGIHCKVIPTGESDWKINLEFPELLRSNDYKNLVDKSTGVGVRLYKGCIWDFVLEVRNAEDHYSGDTFNNNYVFSEKGVEQVYKYLELYFKLWVEKQKENIKVGDKCTSIGNQWTLYEVLVIKDNKAWVKTCDDNGYYYTTNVSDLKKK